MIKGILKLLEGFGATAKEDGFLEEYLQKYPMMRKLFGAGIKVNLVVTSTRATEYASYATYQGKYAITLSDKFWEEYGKDKPFAFSLFTHELGHAVADAIGTAKWIKKANEFGIDVWSLAPSTMEMPLQVYNWEEAFAETFAVLATKDQRGLGLLKQHWPKWIDLVMWAGKSQGVL